jgi:hypothetical protein
MRQKLQPNDFRFIVNNNAVTEYEVEPNRGLLSASINRTRQIQRPTLRLDLVDVADRESNGSDKIAIAIRLPDGCEIDPSDSKTLVRDALGQIVERSVTIDANDNNFVTCTPDLGMEWHSIRTRRQDVMENNVISGISAAAALFGLTRRSDDYEFLLEQVDKISDIFGSRDEIEKRLRWPISSIRKPLNLAV